MSYELEMRGLNCYHIEIRKPLSIKRNQTVMAQKSNSPARFFKVILPSAIFKRKLRIPDSFVVKYGDELSDIVQLFDYVGRVWSVKLEKAKKRLWLDNGWEKFIEAHAIDYGYFLLFKYKGNSSFKVHIFDLSSNEVYYPKHNTNFNGATNLEEHSDDDDDDSVTILDSFPPSKPVASPSRRPAANKTTARAGGNSLPMNPSVTVVMRSYNLRPISTLNLPTAFAREYLPRVVGPLQLHDENGKTWVVRGSIRRGAMSIIAGGWSVFTRDKSLKVGDSCVFEVMDNTKCKLKVSIFSK